MTLGSYKINGTQLTLQPETGEWVPRNEIGISGDGHGVYPSLREYRLTWSFTDPTSFVQLQGFFNALGISGTAIVTLPKYDSATGGFFDYSGCILRDLQPGRYFEGYLPVSLLIAKIQI